MFEYVQDLLFANWGKALGGLTFLMFIPTYWWARYEWRSRRFLSRINYSINFLEGSTLKFRTLRETNLVAAMLNNVHAIRVIKKAPRSEKPGMFLLFKDKDEAWTILTMLLNELSAEFPEGFVARSMGLPTKSEWFYIGITCEEHTDLKSTKFRVMIVSRKMLESIDTFGNVEFEKSHHHIRLATLKQMWQIVQNQNLNHNIMEVELTVKI